VRAVTKVAAIGGGVIGGGWIARFLLNGVDVAVHDPHPQAERIVTEILANAERAYCRLLLAPPAPQGRLSFHAGIAEAVEGAGYVQESVPERLGIKLEVLRAIEDAAPAEALIGSSTSGFRPSELQAGLRTPERVFVAHPFNPVYLLPLVELVGGAATAPAALARAGAFLTTVGMHPLVVRKEIDAHIADRLLEAVWREGLWLIHDDVATTAEVDDAIRFGFGLRWAQMGLFETYRIAGGEAGMRHFIGQFGPALAWPWTKLMDVPELTDDLVEKIASQSDAQSGARPIRELERIRDDNLVGILQALKATGWGAGETLRAMEDRAYARAHAGAGAADPDLTRPLTLHRAQVRGDWVDYNGHMTEFRYLQVFGDATDAFLAFIGMDAAYRAAGGSVYTVETHIRHLRETRAGAKLAVATRILGHDAKRIRLLHALTDEAGTELATAEHMLLHVDAGAGRAAPMRAPLDARVAGIWRAQQGLPRPDHVGRGIRETG